MVNYLEFLTNNSPGVEPVLPGENVEADVVLVLGAVERVERASGHVAEELPLGGWHAFVPVQHQPTPGGQ